ncbi:MAG: WD40 repeat domain-containing protein, partial [Deltaproteobacteria bacterium]|nr:WD40 repeat domain-containing protein [Deltaproteobacteria bacterium]
NMRGAEYLGGIDVFLISTEKNVKLKSEALFNNADVNSVTFSDDRVYAAEATGDVTYPYPAVFEVLGLQGANLVLDGNSIAPLASYAGTSAVFQGSRVYATSGDNGALSVFDSASLDLPEYSFDLHDARWVDVNDGKVVVVQGTPGQISVYDEANMTLPPDVFSFSGANVAESKSTVQVIGGKALIAAGDNGVQVVSLATGNVLGHVPLPDPADLVLDPSVVVTNAVSAEGDLLFISNGEAGVYVAQADTPFEQDWGETLHAITVLGRLQIDALQSVNHVVYKDGLLIVASGLGGLKVVRLSY